jgi:hypothetical protein
MTTLTKENAALTLKTPVLQIRRTKAGIGSSRQLFWIDPQSPAKNPARRSAQVLLVNR